MLQVPPTHAETERLLAETRAMDVLEAELAADLDFGGISTSQVQEGIPEKPEILMLMLCIMLELYCTVHFLYTALQFTMIPDCQETQ